MAKPIKSTTRKLLFTMINKYKDLKSDLNSKYETEIQHLDEIATLTESISHEHEDVKTKVKNLVDDFKSNIRSKMMSTEQAYLEKISSMTDMLLCISCGFLFKEFAPSKLIGKNLRFFFSFTEISVRTLKRIKKEGTLNGGCWNTPGKKRPHPLMVSDLDSFDISGIRNKINEFYVVKKQAPTLRSLYNDLKGDIDFRGCVETLRKILLKNGFEFKTNPNERSLLIEKYEISIWRHKYLRTINEKRQEGKQIIYLDETYVHQNYKVKKSWQGPSTSGVTTKISNGKRHIIVSAGSEEGFVPNSLLIYSTKSKSADYHDDMNAENFIKWLKEKLLPNITRPSVIVMDNASYHVKQINKPPTMSNTKADMRKWLEENNIHFDEYLSYERRIDVFC